MDGKVREAMYVSPGLMLATRVSGNSLQLLPDGFGVGTLWQPCTRAWCESCGGALPIG